jgi:hypothetical protein
MIADCGLKDAGCGRTPEAECAKQTQFGPAGGQMRETNPIPPAAGVWRRQNVQNKPNLRMG